MVFGVQFSIQHAVYEFFSLTLTAVSQSKEDPHKKGWKQNLQVFQCQEQEQEEEEEEEAGDTASFGTQQVDLLGVGKGWSILGLNYTPKFCQSDGRGMVAYET